MYYEEKVIDGVLSYRRTPDGEWIPFAPDEVLGKLLESERARLFYASRINELERAFRIALSVADDDPILITDADKEIYQLREQLRKTFNSIEEFYERLSDIHSCEQEMCGCEIHLLLSEIGADILSRSEWNPLMTHPQPILTIETKGE